MSVIAVVGLQWGDEGKGKICDVLTERADVVARFSGGDNAGHTIVIGDDKIILNLIPSGILREETMSVIGPGMVINPEVLKGEIERLRALGYEVSKETLIISPKAHIITPVSLAFEERLENLLGKNKVGTTMRGIGPTYALKLLRFGLRVEDLFDKTTLVKRLNFLVDAFADGDEKVLDECYDKLTGVDGWIGEFIGDVSILLSNSKNDGENILLEGAQGTMLDIDFGTYPFVTSSNTTVGAISRGLGVPLDFVDTVVGVMKAYTTRVGAGPLPTEEESVGDLLREVGGEYGARTGRPRRCGWLDLLQCEYAVRLNGVDYLTLTKLDILDDFDKIKVCNKYLTNDTEIDTLPPFQSEFFDANPEYIELDGWGEDISEIHSYEDLPHKTRKYIEYLSSSLQVPVSHISNGADRKNTIELVNLWG